MSKKKHRPSRITARSTSQQFMSELGKADSFLRRRRWSEAHEILEALDQRYPNRVEVLTNLVNVCYELNDMKGYQEFCERLLKITPDDPEITSALAGAYLTNLRPALALRTFRRFLDRWPNHDRADDVRKTAADLEAKMADVLAEAGFPSEGGLELAALHEEVQCLLEQGKYPQARTVAEQLLRHHPNFAPALNNISQTYYAEGRLDQAIATAQRVLAFAPDNYHALSNLTRYLCLSGPMDEAKQWAERLKAVESDAVDVWVKKAEALSYLGDDQGVLDAFSGAERAGHLKPPLGAPLLYHLAAVAAMRLGREDQARQYWRQALKLAPGLELARDNLADLRQPVGKRHTPWAFDLGNWVTRKTIDDLVTDLEPATRRGREEALTHAARRYLRQHPEIAGLVPLLLDRGDPKAREFALRIALMAETPDMLAALRDFALSQRGPDEMRQQATSAASKAGLLPLGPMRVWIQGEWHEIVTMGFELHSEPLWSHQPQVERWVREATSLLKQGDADQAERLLEQALAVEPEALDLLNNLAAAYELQGRFQEAETIVRQLYQHHPDYLFARTNMVRLHLHAGDIDQAEALLKPLLARRRFHFSEFAAFCSAQIELLVEQKNPDAARGWLDIWSKADPDNPTIDRWRQRLGKPRRWHRLFGWHA